MKYGKTILCSTALATLLAGSAMAQTVGDTVEDTADTMGNVVSETGETVGDAVDNTGEMLTEDTEAGAEGSVVLSADAEQIGTVESVETLAGGQTALVIDLDDSLGLPVERVRVGAEAEADGSYELAMSRAEFISAINTKLNAQAN